MSENSNSFRKGRRKTGGRKRGTPNKSTKLLREVVLLAAAAAGSERADDGLYRYLKNVAKKSPAIFIPLLSRCLPLQVESQQTQTVEVNYRTANELREELIRRGVPIDSLFPVPKAADKKA